MEATENESRNDFTTSIRASDIIDIEECDSAVALRKVAWNDSTLMKTSSKASWFALRMLDGQRYPKIPAKRRARRSSGSWLWRVTTKKYCDAMDTNEARVSSELSHGGGLNFFEGWETYEERISNRSERYLSSDITLSYILSLGFSYTGKFKILVLTHEDEDRSL